MSECPDYTFYHDIKAELYRQWIKAKKWFIDKIDFGIEIRQERINQEYSDCTSFFMNVMQHCLKNTMADAQKK